MHLLHWIIIVTSVFGFLVTEYLMYYLVLQFLILCSWLWYGLYDKRWGRCVVTEIQWTIKEAFHRRPATESYIQYWLRHKLGIRNNESTVEKYIMAVYVLTFLLGIARYLQSTQQ